MNWLILFVAGLFEVAWAIGLKYTDGFTRLWPSVATVAAMVVSVVLLGIAMKTLPPDAKQRGAAEREKKGVLAADALSLALPCLALPCLALQTSPTPGFRAGPTPAKRRRGATT